MHRLAARIDPSGAIVEGVNCGIVVVLGKIRGS